MQEEFRLDVDGRYPQMKASGVRTIQFSSQVYWIANLKKVSTYRYEGKIWYKYGSGSGSFPYNGIRVKVNVASFPANSTAEVEFLLNGVVQLTRTYKLKSPFFRKVEFEYDYEAGITPVTAIDPTRHPVHDPTLTPGSLSIQGAFARMGIQATKSGGDSAIPSALTGGNGVWSDMEMHDAMQIYWSRFANQAQWALWTFFGKQHDWGWGLGGIMFDSIGPNHRQGTALFYNSFISDRPSGDPDPAAFVERMQFWTAVHEMGHSFNLAHSWQKSLGAPWGSPWISLADEPDARSFMNYPYNVAGGVNAFFANFDHRFSDGELMFLRHAPEPFVQMGNFDWFDHHGAEAPGASQNQDLQLIVRLNRPDAVYESLEPVTVELKLLNSSGEPMIVSSNALKDSHHLVVVVQRKGDPARVFRPFANYCLQSKRVVLEAGAS
ncbi:MAG: hypothetical protein AAB316_00020, partial [Bacteroidota bacterium]